eukprot:snap_masked-scaffold_1-processed-gene-4.42-mRNA-1 protein AED:1.00 eAED:1.00 QI:0/-1/0/0/-1/1/1/0/4102
MVSDSENYSPAKSDQILLDLCGHCVLGVSTWIKELANASANRQSKTKGLNAVSLTGEIIYWKRRTEVLKLLSTKVLTGDIPQFLTGLRTVCGKLLNSNRKYFAEQGKVVGGVLEEWKTVIQQFNEAGMEAEDNTKYLQTLEVFLPVCMSGSISQLQDIIGSLCAALKLIFTVSRFYNTTEKFYSFMSVLITQILCRCVSCITESVPEMLQKPRNVASYFLGKEIIDSDRKALLLGSVEKFLCVLYHSLKELSNVVFPNLKGRESEQADHKVLKPIELMRSRLNKILFLQSEFAAIYELKKSALREFSLFCVEADGAVASLAATQLDIFDLDSHLLEKEIVVFHDKIEKLEVSLEEVVQNELLTSSSAVECLDKLKIYKDVLKKPRLRTKLEENIGLVLTVYHQSLANVQELYEQHKLNPELSRLSPQVSGNIAWVKHLALEIEKPILELKNIQHALNSKEGHEVVRVYNRVIKALVGYEVLFFRAWEEHCRTVITALQRPIYNLEQEVPYPFFSQSLKEVLRDGIALQQLHLSLPGRLSLSLLQREEILCNFHTLIRVSNALNSFCHNSVGFSAPIINNIVSSFIHESFGPAERMNWASVRLPVFTRDITKKMKNLVHILEECHVSLSENLEMLVRSVSGICFVKIPSSTVCKNQYISSQKKFLELACKTVESSLSEGNTILESVVNQFLKEESARKQTLQLLENQFLVRLSAGLQVSLKRCLKEFRSRLYEGIALGGEKPIFQIEGKLHGYELRFSPSFENLKNILLEPFINLNIFLQNFQKLQQCLSVEVLGDLDMCVQCLLIAGKIHELSAAVKVFLTDIDKLNWVWSRDKDEEFRKFLRNKPDLEEYVKTLSKFAHAEESAISLPSTAVKGILFFQCTNLKSTILYELQGWKKCFGAPLKEKLVQELDKSLNEISSVTTNVHKINLTDRFGGDIYTSKEVEISLAKEYLGYKMLLDTSLDLYCLCCTFDARLLELCQLYDLLRSNKVPLPDEVCISKKLSKCKHTWTELQGLEPAFFDQLSKKKAQLLHIVISSENMLATSVYLLLQDLNQYFARFSSDLQENDCFTNLELQYMQLERTAKTLKQVQNGLGLVSHPNHVFCYAAICVTGLKGFLRIKRKLLVLTRKWTTTKLLRYTDINSDKSALQELERLLLDIPKTVQEKDDFVSLSRSVRLYGARVWLVSMLCQPWIEKSTLEEISHFLFEARVEITNLTVIQLFSLAEVKNELECTRLSFAAEKIFRQNVSLNRLSKKWRSFVFLFNSPRDIIQFLEHLQGDKAELLKLDSAKNLPNQKETKQVLLELLNKLEFFFTHLISCSNRRDELKGVFDTSDIRFKVPVGYQLLQKATDELSSLYELIKRQKYVYVLAQYDSLRTDMEKLHHSLEGVEFRLREFVAQERKVCPRLYFLTIEEIIALVKGNGLVSSSYVGFIFPFISEIFAGKDNQCYFARSRWQVRFQEQRHENLELEGKLKTNLALCDEIQFFEERIKTECRGNIKQTIAQFEESSVNKLAIVSLLSERRPLFQSKELGVHILCSKLSKSSESDGKFSLDFIRDVAVDLRQIIGREQHLPCTENIKLELYSILLTLASYQHWLTHIFELQSENIPLSFLYYTFLAPTKVLNIAVGYYQLNYEFEYTGLHSVGYCLCTTMKIQFAIFSAMVKNRPLRLHSSEPGSRSSLVKSIANILGRPFFLHEFGFMLSEHSFLSILKGSRQQSAVVCFLSEYPSAQQDPKFLYAQLVNWSLKKLNVDNSTARNTNICQSATKCMSLILLMDTFQRSAGASFGTLFPHIHCSQPLNEYFSCLFFTVFPKFWKSLGFVFANLWVDFCNVFSICFDERFFESLSLSLTKVSNQCTNENEVKYFSLKCLLCHYSGVFSSAKKSYLRGLVEPLLSGCNVPQLKQLLEREEVFAPGEREGCALSRLLVIGVSRVGKSTFIKEHIQKNRSSTVNFQLARYSPGSFTLDELNTLRLSNRLGWYQALWPKVGDERVYRVLWLDDMDLPHMRPIALDNCLERTLESSHARKQKAMIHKLFVECRSLENFAPVHIHEFSVIHLKLVLDDFRAWMKPTVNIVSQTLSRKLKPKLTNLIFTRFFDIVVSPLLKAHNSILLAEQTLGQLYENFFHLIENTLSVSNIDGEGDIVQHNVKQLLVYCFIWTLGLSQSGPENDEFLSDMKLKIYEFSGQQLSPSPFKFRLDLCCFQWKPWFPSELLHELGTFSPDTVFIPPHDFNRVSHLINLYQCRGKGVLIRSPVTILNKRLISQLNCESGGVFGVDGLVLRDSSACRALFEGSLSYGAIGAHSCVEAKKKLFITDFNAPSKKKQFHSITQFFFELEDSREITRISPSQKFVKTTVANVCIIYQVARVHALGKLQHITFHDSISGEVDVLPSLLLQEVATYPTIDKELVLAVLKQTLAFRSFWNSDSSHHSNLAIADSTNLVQIYHLFYMGLIEFLFCANGKPLKSVEVLLSGQSLLCFLCVSACNQNINNVWPTEEDLEKYISNSFPKQNSSKLQNIRKKQTSGFSKELLRSEKPLFTGHLNFCDKSFTSLQDLLSKFTSTLGLAEEYVTEGFVWKLCFLLTGVKFLPVVLVSSFMSQARTLVKKLCETIAFTVFELEGGEGDDVQRKILRECLEAAQDKKVFLLISFSPGNYYEIFYFCLFFSRFGVPGINSFPASVRAISFQSINLRAAAKNFRVGFLSDSYGYTHSMQELFPASHEWFVTQNLDEFLPALANNPREDYSVLLEAIYKLASKNEINKSLIFRLPSISYHNIFYSFYFRISEREQIVQSKGVELQRGFSRCEKEVEQHIQEINERLSTLSSQKKKLKEEVENQNTALKVIQQKQVALRQSTQQYNDAILASTKSGMQDEDAHNLQKLPGTNHAQLANEINNIQKSALNSFHVAAETSDFVAILMDCIKLLSRSYLFPPEHNEIRLKREISLFLQLNRSPEPECADNTEKFQTLLLNFVQESRSVYSAEVFSLLAVYLQVKDLNAETANRVSNIVRIIYETVELVSRSFLRYSKEANKNPVEFPAVSDLRQKENVELFVLGLEKKQQEIADLESNIQNQITSLTHSLEELSLCSTTMYNNLGQLQALSKELSTYVENTLTSRDGVSGNRDFCNFFLSIVLYFGGPLANNARQVLYETFVQMFFHNKEFIMYSKDFQAIPTLDEYVTWALGSYNLTSAIELAGNFETLFFNAVTGIAVIIDPTMYLSQKKMFVRSDGSIKSDTILEEFIKANVSAGSRHFLRVLSCCLTYVKSRAQEISDILPTGATLFLVLEDEITLDFHEFPVLLVDSLQEGFYSPELAFQVLNTLDPQVAEGYLKTSERLLKLKTIKYSSTLSLHSIILQKTTSKEILTLLLEVLSAFIQLSDIENELCRINKQIELCRENYPYVFELGRRLCVLFYVSTCTCRLLPKTYTSLSLSSFFTVVEHVASVGAGTLEDLYEKMFRALIMKFSPPVQSFFLTLIFCMFNSMGRFQVCLDQVFSTLFGHDLPSQELKLSCDQLDSYLEYFPKEFSDVAKPITSSLAKDKSRCKLTSIKRLEKLSDKFPKHSQVFTFLVAASIMKDPVYSYILAFRSLREGCQLPNKVWLPNCEDIAEAILCQRSFEKKFPIVVCVKNEFPLMQFFTRFSISNEYRLRFFFGSKAMARIPTESQIRNAEIETLFVIWEMNPNLTDLNSSFFFSKNAVIIFVAESYYQLPMNILKSSLCYRLEHWSSPIATSFCLSKNFLTRNELAIIELESWRSCITSLRDLYVRQLISTKPQANPATFAPTNLGFIVVLLEDYFFEVKTCEFISHASLNYILGNLGILSTDVKCYLGPLRDHLKDSSFNSIHVTSIVEQDILLNPDDSILNRQKLICKQNEICLSAVLEVLRNKILNDVDKEKFAERAPLLKLITMKQQALDDRVIEGNIPKDGERDLLVIETRNFEQVSRHLCEIATTGTSSPLVIAQTSSVKLLLQAVECSHLRNKHGSFLKPMEGRPAIRATIYCPVDERRKLESGSIYLRYVSLMNAECSGNMLKKCSGPSLPQSVLLEVLPSLQRSEEDVHDSDILSKSNEVSLPLVLGGETVLWVSVKTQCSRAELFACEAHFKLLQT